MADPKLAAESRAFVQTISDFLCQSRAIAGIHEREEVVVLAGETSWLIGGVGKTQLCRRMRNLPFDPSVPTTHRIQLGEMTVTLENFPEPVRLNLWDFGGQDIYHGCTRFFFTSNSVAKLQITKQSAESLIKGPKYYEQNLVYHGCR